MPSLALAERRPWLLASLVFGISYWLIDHSQVPGLYGAVWKGGGVALLAVYAWVHHPAKDAHRIALVMALGAIGDMVLEFDFTGGAAVFLAGHLCAIALYVRHQRSNLARSDRVVAVALLAGVPLAGWLLTGALPVSLYALALGGMAAAAWLSRFPRRRVGLGGLLFVLSDLLIFARMGPLAHSAIPGLLIWPTYYFGQFLITVGVIGELRRRGEFAAP